MRCVPCPARESATEQARPSCTIIVDAAINGFHGLLAAQACRTPLRIAPPVSARRSSGSSSSTPAMSPYAQAGAIGRRFDQPARRDTSTATPPAPQSCSPAPPARRRSHMHSEPGIMLRPSPPAGQTACAPERTSPESIALPESPTAAAPCFRHSRSAARAVAARSTRPCCLRRATRNARTPASLAWQSQRWRSRRSRTSVFTQSNQAQYGAAATTITSTTKARHERLQNISPDASFSPVARALSAVDNMFRIWQLEVVQPGRASDHERVTAV